MKVIHIYYSFRYDYDSEQTTLKKPRAVLQLTFSSAERRYIISAADANFVKKKHIVFRISIFRKLGPDELR
jgi:hypothetical protein